MILWKKKIIKQYGQNLCGGTWQQWHVHEQTSQCWYEHQLWVENFINFEWLQKVINGNTQTQTISL